MAANIDLLSEWVGSQRAEYGSRDESDDNLRKLSHYYNAKMVGVSGEIVDRLKRQNSPIVPIEFWGGVFGWVSGKRKSRFLKLIRRSCDSEITMGSNCVLLRCVFNPVHYIPHPYCPPIFALASKDKFIEYITDVPGAFELAQQWRVENSIAARKAVNRIIGHLPIISSGSYRCHNKVDYLEIAFMGKTNLKGLLDTKREWIHEEMLYELVSSIFADAIREYSPDWLGRQRIDIYIPSIGVAIEYQGEQHSLPIEHFGGKDGLEKRTINDRKKMSLCKKYGVKLLYWEYYEPITRLKFEEKLLSLDPTLSTKSDRTALT